MSTLSVAAVLDVLASAACGTFGYLAVLAAALVAAKFLQFAERLCPDIWLWRAFHAAAIGIACIDLSLLVTQHATRLVEHLQA